MKKSTLAIAALLTTLSTATIVPAAYADDSATTPAATCTGCTGCKGACAGCNGCKGACAGSDCKGCSGSDE